ncbi:hypothetical protein [Tautonia plasticadhaerens]|uniref:Uncharacterized protein n=1 Tax=Tautonia plasticadhaerens TaxID=2527974 RepID=A0A518HCM6_9BACT|nr:hypothetical protein [Tautonia plasticadhaerens]QDV38609.1 hypothetical protein ElP_65640 [Tautonia plasticadhaerens]
MRAIRAGRRLSQLLALAAVCGVVMIYAGCGGPENETVIPKEPPAEKAKDSMDYYRNQMQQK